MEHDDNSGHGARFVGDWSYGLLDLFLGSISRNQYLAGPSFFRPSRNYADDRRVGWRTRSRFQSLQYFRQIAVRGVTLGPACQSFRGRVQKLHRTETIGCDDAVSDAPERGDEPLSLFADAGFHRCFGKGHLQCAVKRWSMNRLVKITIGVGRACPLDCRLIRIGGEINDGNLKSATNDLGRLLRHPSLPRVQCPSVRDPAASVPPIRSPPPRNQ